jgi:hypothetical protein
MPARDPSELARDLSELTKRITIPLIAQSLGALLKSACDIIRKITIVEDAASWESTLPQSKSSGQNMTTGVFSEESENPGFKVPCCFGCSFDSGVLYLENEKNKELDPKKINYPSADTTAIFTFIEEVSG